MEFCSECGSQDPIPINNGKQQIVLPQKYRQRVLELAHDKPMAGHMGAFKTRQRLLKRFFWPTICKDIKDYCRQAHAKKGNCRAKKGNCRAPMVPLPSVEEPFSRIAMDIVGPLPKSKHGHKYILVVCDYATRYPEAIPLKKFTTPAIAEELVELFARHGIPKEILTDQGTNFTSQLLLELYRMLWVKAIRTTPYHPQTDGLVERFNQTLKQMLRKTIDEEGSEWDKLLPCVLFAYREVPQSSNGFSPFELIYGRDVRGPLDVLKEDWIHNQLKDDDIVSYVTRIYERLKEGREAVQENLRKSQLKQKKWYDKRARDITSAEGDKVLVLLPTRTEKLLAKWKGPYKVLRKVGRVNYEIEVSGEEKKRSFSTSTC